MRQLDAQKGRRIRRHGSGQRRAKAREKRAQPSLAVHLTNNTANSNIATLSRLQPRLDRIDGEDRDPHGHTSRRTGARNRRQAKLARGFSRSRVHGGEFPLDVLVRGEIGGRAGPVAGQGSSGAAENGANAPFAVELADDVDTARVAGLLARLELLVLDLEDDLDAFEGGGDGGHGDRGEETCGGDLGDG